MYHQTFHCGRKYFFRYCVQELTTEEILKSHINDCFKKNGKQIIKMPKESEYVKFKNYERKIIICVSCKFLVPEDDEKQNPDEYYTSNYQEHVTYSYTYKLVCVDEKIL